MQPEQKFHCLVNCLMWQDLSSDTYIQITSLYTKCKFLIPILLISAFLSCEVQDNPRSGFVIQTLFFLSTENLDINFEY